MSATAEATPPDPPALQARLRELESCLAELRARQRATDSRLALLEGLVERLPLGLHIYRLDDAEDDRSLVLLAANQAAEAMTGVPSEVIVGRTIDANFPDLRAQNIPQSYATVAKGGEPLVLESLHYGDERVIAAAFSVRAVPLPDRCVGVVFENITERKQAEERLTLFETLAETALDGVAFSNLEGVLEYGNPAFQAMTGFGAAVVGTPIPGFFGADEQPYIHEVLLPSLGGEGRWAGTLPALRPDGTTWMAHISIMTLADAQGRPRKLAGVCRDVTRQQAQEQRLRQVEVMVENAPDGFSLTELDGRLVYLNPAFCMMLGYNTPLVGAPLLELFAEHEHGRVPQLMQQVLKEGNWQGTLSYRRADGSTFDAQLTAFVVRDATGASVGLAGIARDLTEEQQRERERAELQEQVIQAQQAALRELSTPLIPLAKGVVAMPLIGSIDSSRAQQVLETLLEGVAASRANTAIIDITGVPVVDTQVANALLRAAHAVKLLGAQVVLTGIRPEVAQTLVGLGADLGGIVTRATLQSGIAFGMGQA